MNLWGCDRSLPKTTDTYTSTLEHCEHPVVSRGPISNTQRTFKLPLPIKVFTADIWSKARINLLQAKSIVFNSARRFSQSHVDVPVQKLEKRCQ